MGHNQEGVWIWQCGLVGAIVPCQQIRNPLGFEGHEAHAVIAIAAQEPSYGAIAESAAAVENHQQPGSQIVEVLHTNADAFGLAGDSCSARVRSAFYTEATMSIQSPAAKHTRSQALQQRAERYFPGGVNSPVRAFRAVGGAPPFVDRAEGAWLTDADGNRYIDYFGSWGPMILGHAFPPVVEAIERAARNSASFGASVAAEANLAERVVACYPAIEKLRFVSSGTEATMSAIRLARAATGRNIIVKFEGCYHGHSDGLLVKAGSGVATFGIPGSAGVPDAIAHLTLALRYNDLNAVEEAFAAHSGEIAAVILEPVVGNAGCIPPAPGYLEGLRRLTIREGALLIVDEVMTGFRVALGGALELHNIDADLVTLGKIVGGGLPVGVFGGKGIFMDLLAPLGPVYQAGTLSGNPLAMAAGIATVGYLQDHAAEVYAKLEATSKEITEGVTAEAAKAGVPLTLNRVGAMWTWFFTAEAVTNYDDAKWSDTAAFGRFHRAMLDQGVWLPPSQFEAAFLSTAHGDEEVAITIAAAREAFKTLGNG
jgi:glutamate-1-semialdehyde 2,1-aminomutase